MGLKPSLVIERGGSVPYVWPDSLCQVTPAGDAERDLVGQGDVLFLSRGQRLYAVPVLQPLENMVTSYYFYSFPTCHVKASGDVWRHVPLGTPGSSPAPYATLERGVPRAGAVLSPRKNAWPSVSTSQRGRLYILRSDADRVDPAYLAWFMNRPTAPAFQERRQRGALERLRQQEAYIMSRLVQARKQLVNGLALRAAQERHSTTEEHMHGRPCVTSRD